MHYNIVRVLSSTLGTGTITLGAAVAGCLTFADGGVPNGAVVTYGISDGSHSEVGRGTYDSGAGTLTRDQVLASTNAGAKIVLSGNEQVYITVVAEDLLRVEPVLPADHKASGIIGKLKAHDAQAFGDMVFINADGEAAIAKADVIANACAVAMCVDATIDANAYGNYMFMGIARDDSWNWTVGGDGGRIYLSATGTTGNTLTQTAPTATDTVTKPVGYALSADTMILYPNSTEIEHA